MSRIPEAVIRRLPRYYRKLKELQDRQVERISSQELGRLMCLTASQVRQDFNRIGGLGQQGYGYSVEDLCQHLRKTLGLVKTYTLVIIGAGNIGQALARYAGFAQEQIQILAIFDNDPARVGLPVGKRTVLSLDVLEQFLANHSVDIGVIATPGAYAQETSARLRGLGISNIWNFAPVDLNYADGLVENVSLSDSLYTLLFHMQENLLRNDA